jgi:5-methylcytosine-specific restriction enzyme B
VTSTVEQREALWDEFLQRWPLEKLSIMTLEEYTDAGNNDSFVYWLEAKTEELGSIWGGSSFKFGVYSRRDKTPKTTEGKLSYNEQYAWYSKYGDSPQQAFERVREKIVAVANAARSGDFESIRSIDLGRMVKWKIAFLYQDRKNPQLIPVYNAEYLAAFLGQKSKNSVWQLQKTVAVQRNNENVLSFGEKVWKRAEEILMADVLKPEDAVAYFQEQPERFRPIKDPTKYLAGFETVDGKQLAVSLRNSGAKIWLEPGPWLEHVQRQLKDIEHYPADRSRTSNLAANSPRLAEGNPVMFLTVPSRAALYALANAYDGTDSDDSLPMENNMDRILKNNPPINQILYGPPGTGKTYATIDAALEILDPAAARLHVGDRKYLKNRFDEFVEQGRIRFVTFHQSFSYEDFVEGLRANSDEDGQVRYEVADGIFKSICEAASAQVTQQIPVSIDMNGRRIWKMSIGDSHKDDDYLFEESVENGYVLLGWGGGIDFSGCQSREDIVERHRGAGKEVSGDEYRIAAITTFLLKIKEGDLIVVTDGNLKFRAIAEVTGGYKFLADHERVEQYVQSRRVKWLRIYSPSLSYDQLMKKRFMQQSLYELKPNAIDTEKLGMLLNGNDSGSDVRFHVGQRFGGYEVTIATNEIVELRKPNGNDLPFSMKMLHSLVNYVRSGQINLADIQHKRVFERIPDSTLEKYIVNGYSTLILLLVEHLTKGASPAAAPGQSNNAKVLIIDEINRGNVSRIFGELITLIEPSKRAGNAEALEVSLPYSKMRFSVPSNVYLIGTMNTADRSLSGLDIALRRRFTFKEMPPRPGLLKDIDVEGINIGQLLEVMNQRIEVLIDRDHCLGHAYFMPLREDRSLVRLSSIFRNQIIPLLQEYFFENWERIQWVLNDHQKRAEDQFISKPQFDPQLLFGDGVDVAGHGVRWQINDKAFDRIDAYRGIINSEPLAQS